MASRPTSRAIARCMRSSRPTSRCLRESTPLQSIQTYRSIHSNTSPLQPLTRFTRPTSSIIPKQAKRTLFIQTETTPNPDAVKFKPNNRVLPEDFPSSFIEYLNPRSTLSPPHPSPLASSLFSVDGVTSIFFGADYITVTKDPSTLWAHINPEVFSLITEAIAQGAPLVKTVEGSSDADGQTGGVDSLAYDENDSQVVSEIKELLETRIRPAIQEDGGDIEFRGFEDGQVFLKLRGACRTCDSSTVTLRNGIESMLMHYIEEVKGVQQVLDQEEEIAIAEFQKFEERLRAQQGYVPPATTGKGTIDTVE